MKKKGLLSSLSGGNKIFLLICLAAAFTVDFTVMVYLLVGGIQGQFWLFPMLFAIADLAFIVQAVFSNFRFKYTVIEIVAYIAVTLIALAIMLWVDVFPGGQRTYFTTATAACWFALHLGLLVAALVSYLHATKFLRGKAGAALAVLVSVVCIAGAGFYGSSLAAVGFLGQGPEIYVRPLEYAYDSETDGYAVRRVLNGKGSSITVPDEFNGKKVTKIYGEVFANSLGITDITLDCDPTVAFENIENYYISEALTVHTPRDSADAFRQSFFKNNVHALANAVAPSDLADDEVFVTFSYDEGAYDDAKGKILPTYIGKKGTAFNLGYFKDIPYAIHADRQSDDDLFWCLNNGGKILKPLAGGQSVQRSAGAGNLDGAVLTQNVTAVKIGFEKVYKVYPVGSDFSSNYINNDKKYNFAEHFVCSEVGGQKLDYKLTVAEYADEILAGQEREGFSLKWYYASGTRTSQYQIFTSLKSECESGLPRDTTGESPNFVTLAPAWELNSPEVSVTTSLADNAVTYGEAISLNMTAKPPIAGAKMKYYWERTNEYGYTQKVDCETTTYDMTNVYPSEAGEYFCTVSCYPESTSLSSYATGKVTVKVNPRVLALKWTEPENDVYDATEKTVNCDIVDGVINGDSVRLIYGANAGTNSFRLTNAGVHTLSVGLQSESGKYTLDDSREHSYEIKKAPLYVEWDASETTKTFNGYVQIPAMTYTGACGSDIITFTHSTNFTDAGEYTFYDRLSDTPTSSNYYIAGCESALEHSFTSDRATTKFIIKPCPVDITMGVAGFSGTSFTYDGKGHSVTAAATGVFGSAIVVNTSVNSVKNAGTHTITATPASKNYVAASGDTLTVVINKRQVSSFELTNYILTYNGAIQFPSAYFNGVGDDSRITVTGTGGAKDAGDYAFYGTTPSNSNYEIVGSPSRAYSIKPYTYRINWSGTRVTYDGRSHLPVASVTGVGNDGALSFKVEYIGGAAPVNSGNYTCRATLLDGENYLAKNYTVDTNYGNQTQLQIDRAVLNVTPENYTMRAGDSFVNLEGKLTFKVTGFVGGDKQSDFNFGSVECSIEGYNGGSLLAGTYTIKAGTPSGEHDQPLSDNYVLHFGTATLTVPA